MAAFGVPIWETLRPGYRPGIESRAETHLMIRWRIAILVSAAITISYLDRQTLPVAIGEISKDIPITNQVKAFLDSAFLLAYGLMYVGGGRLMDVLGTRRGLRDHHDLLVAGVRQPRPRDWRGHAGDEPAAPRRGRGRRLSRRDARGGRMVSRQGTLDGHGHHQRRHRARRDRRPAAHRVGDNERGLVRHRTLALGLLHHRRIRSGVDRLVGQGILRRPTSIRVCNPPSACILQSVAVPTSVTLPTVPIAELFRFRETWGIVSAKFLTDAAWYFYMFWLPKYLLDVRGFNIKGVGSVAWIPFAAAALGCLVGGGLSSWLLHRGYSVNASRKIALGMSAAMMPCVMLVPYASVPWVIVLFSVAFFGQQSWSTLVMILPTDLFPRHALGTVAGFVGLGGALGGVVLGQTGWLPARPWLQLHARAHHCRLAARDGVFPDPRHRAFAAPASVASPLPCLRTGSSALT